MKFTVTGLRGFENKLTATLDGLPEGLHADALDLSGKTGEATLKLIAAPDAKPAQRPVRILITEPGKNEARAVVFSLISSTEDNGVPGGYTRLLVESTDQLWLTVKPKAAPK